MANKLNFQLVGFKDLSSSLNTNIERIVFRNMKIRMFAAAVYNDILARTL